MQKIFTLFTFLVFFSFSQAQNTNLPILALGFTNPQVKGFTEDQNTLLRSKALEAMSAGQVAVYDYSLNFFLQPDFAVVSKKVAEGGLRKIYVVTANLLLSIKNQTNQQVISAKSVSLTGSGISEEEALSNAINSIEPDASAIQDFLTQSKEKMSNYYKSQCTVLSNEFEILLAKKSYETVLVRLATIPSENKDCLDKMKTVRTKALKLYQQQKATPPVSKTQVKKNSSPADHSSSVKTTTGRNTPNSAPAKANQEPAFSNVSNSSNGSSYSGDDPVQSIALAILSSKQLTK